MAESLSELNFEQLLNESMQPLSLLPGSIVTGEVVDIDNDDVTVNVGLKSEGVIPRDQFLNREGVFELAIGDRVQVAMEAVDDGKGETRLSREKAKRKETWDKLEDALENQSVVTGIINGKIKGGFTVDVGEIRAFLPGSLVDIRPIRDIKDLEGKELGFQVIKLDQRRNNVVLSRRAVIEEEFSEEKEQLIKELAEGQTKNGFVKNLTEYGAFIDLGGIDGLLHITDMAWRRVRHPSEVVSVGDEIEVKILSFDAERMRVSLGLKQLGDDPWVKIMDRYPPNTQVEATVTNVTDYGCFAEIGDGIEGLVHVSEMDWLNRNIIPSKYVTIGEKIQVMILHIDEEQRRVSLGMKQCTENPWLTFSKNFEEGDRVTGTVKSKMDFGLFVSLPGGVDGLVHIQDLHWTDDPEDRLRRYSKGEEVETQVLIINPNEQKIALGIKQLEANPFIEYTKEHHKGDVVTGEVVDFTASSGAVLQLAENVHGEVRKSDASKDRVEDIRHIMKVGDELEVMITNIDLRGQSIRLSVKAKEQKEEQEATQAYKEKTEEEAKGPSIGDMIRESQQN